MGLDQAWGFKNALIVPTMPPDRGGDYEEGWCARLREIPYDEDRVTNWRNGWYDADCALKWASHAQTNAGPTTYAPLPEPSEAETRRHTAARLAGQWASRTDSRPDMERMAERICRWLETGSFEEKAK